MLVKGINDTDLINYKKISMFIAFPKCTYKCEKECGKRVCQNGALAKLPDVEVSIDHIIELYSKNILTHAIVCGGLEPMDSWEDLYELIKEIRKHTEDDIVIYTGYNYNEISDKILLLSDFKNIIIKFGRYIPDQEKHYDDILGVDLASDNQHARKIS